MTVVLESEVIILDPHIITAAITRTFGYHVFDTLFAMDEQGEIKPQMVGATIAARRAHLVVRAARRPQVARRQSRHRGGLRGLAASAGGARTRWGKMLMADTARSTPTTPRPSTSP